MGALTQRPVKLSGRLQNQQVEEFRSNDNSEWVVYAGSIASRPTTVICTLDAKTGEFYGILTVVGISSTVQQWLMEPVYWGSGYSIPSLGRRLILKFLRIHPVPKHF